MANQELLHNEKSFMEDTTTGAVIQPTLNSPDIPMSKFSSSSNIAAQNSNFHQDGLSQIPKIIAPSTSSVSNISNITAFGSTIFPTKNVDPSLSDEDVLHRLSSKLYQEKFGRTQLCGISTYSNPSSISPSQSNINRNTAVGNMSYNSSASGSGSRSGSGSSSNSSQNSQIFSTHSTNGSALFNTGGPNSKLFMNPSGHSLSQSSFSSLSSSSFSNVREDPAPLSSSHSTSASTSTSSTSSSSSEKVRMEDRLNMGVSDEKLLAYVTKKVRSQSTNALSSSSLTLAQLQKLAEEKGDHRIILKQQQQTPPKPPVGAYLGGGSVANILSSYSNSNNLASFHRSPTSIMISDNSPYHLQNGSSVSVEKNALSNRGNKLKLLKEDKKRFRKLTLWKKHFDQLYAIMQEGLFASSSNKETYSPVMSAKDTEEIVESAFCRKLKLENYFNEDYDNLFSTSSSKISPTSAVMLAPWSMESKKFIKGKKSIPNKPLLWLENLYEMSMDLKKNSRILRHQYDCIIFQLMEKIHQEQEIVIQLNKLLNLNIEDDKEMIWNDSLESTDCSSESFPRWSLLEKCLNDIYAREQTIQWYSRLRMILLLAYQYLKNMEKKLNRYRKLDDYFSVQKKMKENSVAV